MTAYFHLQGPKSCHQRYFRDDYPSVFHDVSCTSVTQKSIIKTVLHPLSILSKKMQASNLPLFLSGHFCPYLETRGTLPA